VAWTLSSLSFRPKSISWSIHQARQSECKIQILGKTRTRKL